MKPHEKLGVAIADAGYDWTPEMRFAWEELDKQINLLESEVVMYRADAEKLTMRLIDISVDPITKELTDKDLDKLIKDAEQLGHMESYIVGLIDGFNYYRTVLGRRNRNE